MTEEQEIMPLHRLYLDIHLLNSVTSRKAPPLSPVACGMSVAVAQFLCDWNQAPSAAAGFHGSKEKALNDSETKAFRPIWDN